MTQYMSLFSAAVDTHAAGNTEGDQQDMNKTAIATATNASNTITSATGITKANTTTTITNDVAVAATAGVKESEHDKKAAATKKKCRVSG
jgi:hypothetical protein